MTTLLMTSYLTCNRHPITGRTVPPNDPALTDRWLVGVLRCGMRAVVVYDQLSPEFVAQRTTPSILFLRVDPPSPGWSNNDWRFRKYLQYLKTLEPGFFKTIFCVDMFDTVVKRDPGPLVESRSDIRLWTGTDRRTPRILAGTKDGDWIVSKIKACYGDEGLPALLGMPYCTAAILGGREQEFRSVLTELDLELEKVLTRRPSVNANMAAVNVVANRLFAPEEIWIEGEPLHSQPCRNDVDADVCFVHK